MNPSPTTSRTWRPFWITIAVLGAVLMWLWRDSFNPQMLAFANDAPFGMMSAYSEFRWSNFWQGSWVPFVWLGNPTLPLQPAFSHGLFLIGGPLAFAKFAAPLSMLLLGIGAYAFCRQQGFHWGVALITALAAALNLNFLSHATWGLGVRATAAGFTLLALAALSRPSGARGLFMAVLAGLSTGYVVIEGADSGAIMTVFIAAYVIVVGALESGPLTSKVFRAILRLFLVVAFAIWVAAYSLSSLIGTQIEGIAGMGAGTQSKQERWEFATGWSFPKLEVIRMAVPGIMGLRSISPGEEMYWGNVGSDGAPPRFNGGSEYVGVLVLILAGWASARALARGGRQPFTPREQALVGFWSVVGLVSLLLSFGRNAPFYQIVFALPYFSTIRVPMKFLHVTHLALLILFAYGVQGICRLNFETAATKSAGHLAGLQAWWKRNTGFERAWAWTLVGMSAGAAAFALIYASFQHSLVQHLAALGFTGAEGQAMAAFSVHEVFYFAAFVMVSCFLLALAASGSFSGEKSGWGLGLLGLILVADLARAAIPFVLHFNYQRRYEPNAVTEFLRDKPWLHRVVARPHPQVRSTFTSPSDGAWPAVHNQWLENQMPYNEIQTLDIWQMPRQPELDKAMLDGFKPESETDLSSIGRLWDLTNVRYVLGARGVESELNRLFAKEQPVFRPVLGFDLTAKPGTSGKGVTLDDITAVPNANGQYAVFENTRALPRAAWFSQWQVVTNDAALLKRLKEPSLEISREVLLSTPTSIPSQTNHPAGNATITRWTPKNIVVTTDSPAPGIVLLNERWHPDWRVSIDGQPAELLRGNLVMRAVAVPAGQHTVEFSYRPSMKMLWVSLSALLVALVLGVWLAFVHRPSR